MGFLLISTALATDGSATGILIGNLIDSYHKLGVEVDCLTVKRSLYDLDKTKYRGSTVYHADYVTSFYQGRKKTKDAILAGIKRLTFHNNTLKYRVQDSWQVSALISALKRIDNGQYDAFITFCANYDSAEAAIKYKEKYNHNVKVCLYQVDPLANNFILSSVNKQKRLTYEKWIFDKCDKVFSTPYILQNQADIWEKSKIVTVELPSIVKKERSVNAVVKQNIDEIRCIYAGDLYKSIRNPQYMLDLFASFSDPRIHLYVLSSGERELLDKYASNSLKGRMNIIGRVGEVECNNWLESADILVNIGNTEKNQLPSKVLNYLCYGKPILNLYKIDDCPSLEYYTKYPLAISVKEKPYLEPSYSENIENRIINIYKERIDYSEIEAKFRTCTPDFIAKQILENVEFAEDIKENSEGKCDGN